MEFKKPNSHNGVRPQRQASRPGDSMLVNPRPIVRPAPPIITAGRQPAPTPSPPPQAARKIAGINRDLLPSRAEIISNTRRVLFTKKGIVIGSIVVVVIAVLIAGSLIHQQNVAKDAANTGNPNEVVQDLEYQTILPDGKSISDFGGWRRVSPLKSDPVYAYTDTIGDISINVSEQPLPKTFTGDTDDDVADLAKKFNATTKIDAGDVKIYVGSSSKGPQSAIFTKNSLLVLVKSQEKIDDASWTKYVKSLN